MKDQHHLSDAPVPPVKGAVTDLQDIVRRPAAVFSPAQPENLQNPAIFDELQ